MDILSFIYGTLVVGIDKRDNNITKLSFIPCFVENRGSTN